MSQNKIIRTKRVADHGDSWHGPSVEMTTEDNLTIVINLPLVGDANPGEPIERALEALVALGSAATQEIGKLRNGTSGKKPDSDEEEQLTQGLKDSFPASDPVSVTTPSTSPKQGEPV